MRLNHNETYNDIYDEYNDDPFALNHIDKDDNKPLKKKPKEKET